MERLNSGDGKETKKEIRKEFENSVRLNKKLLKGAVRPLLAVRREFKNQVSSAIIAALGFVIAIAWKDLVLKLMEELVPHGLSIKYPYLNELFTAAIVTVFAVIGILIVNRWAKENAEEKIR